MSFHLEKANWMVLVILLTGTIQLSDAANATADAGLLQWSLCDYMKFPGCSSETTTTTAATTTTTKAAPTTSKSQDLQCSKIVPDLQGLGYNIQQSIVSTVGSMCNVMVQIGTDSGTTTTKSTKLKSYGSNPLASSMDTQIKGEFCYDVVLEPIKLFLGGLWESGEITSVDDGCMLEFRVNLNARSGTTTTTTPR